MHKINTSLALAHSCNRLFNIVLLRVTYEYPIQISKLTFPKRNIAVPSFHFNFLAFVI